MSINVYIHVAHRHLTGGNSVVKTEGRSVKECLAGLVRQYPDMRHVLFEKEDGLKKEIEIYRNMESTYPGELAEPVTDGDDIHITLVLAGG